MRTFLAGVVLAIALIGDAQADAKRYTLLPGGGYVVSHLSNPEQPSFRVSPRRSYAPALISPFDPRMCAEVRLDAFGITCVVGAPVPGR